MVDSKRGGLTLAARSPDGLTLLRTCSAVLSFMASRNGSTLQRDVALRRHGHKATNYSATWECGPYRVSNAEGEGGRGINVWPIAGAESAERYIESILHRGVVEVHRYSAHGAFPEGMGIWAAGSSLRGVLAPG